MPRDISLYTAKEINDIYKRFFKGFHSFREHPEMKNLIEELNIYRKELKTYNVKDRDVVHLKINFGRIMLNFIQIIPLVIINLLFVLFIRLILCRHLQDLSC